MSEKKRALKRVLANGETVAAVVPSHLAKHCFLVFTSVGRVLMVREFAQTDHRINCHVFHHLVYVGEHDVTEQPR